MEINIFNTYISPYAKEKVSQVLDSTFLSEGKLVKEFENELRSTLGIINPVALNSGTTALHLALVSAGIKPGDEVICPAQTFVASAMVILQENAIPVFADIQYETGNISPSCIENKITNKTKAILVVHWGGYPCDMDEINAIARKHKLIVIEDAAHALGAEYKSKPIGSISEYTCFSFQAIKHLTTGDGGALSCLNDSKTSDAFTARWFGIDRANSLPSVLGERKYDIKNMGYKYHLNDYAAALGLANLVGFHERLKRRSNFASTYKMELSKVPGIKLFTYNSDRKSAYWLFGFHVEKRGNFIKHLKDKGVTASVIHQRIDRNSIFGGIRKDLENQAKFDETQIHIPIHDDLNEEKVEYVVKTIQEGW
jgi:perosamine synthetase